MIDHCLIFVMLMIPGTDDLYFLSLVRKLSNFHTGRHLSEVSMLLVNSNGNTAKLRVNKRFLEEINEPFTSTPALR